MNNHEDIKQLISAYIDGEVSSDEARMIEEHIKECSDCAQYLKEISALSSILPSWADEDLSLDSEVNIKKKLREKREVQKMKPMSLFRCG